MNIFRLNDAQFWAMNQQERMELIARCIGGHDVVVELWTEPGKEPPVNVLIKPWPDIPRGERWTGLD